MDNEFKRQLSVYDIRNNWARRFKPLIADVEPTVRRAIRCLRYDFDPKKHIPREAGWTVDAPWPRTRTCAQAFHMIGYCHIIAVVMLDLAQRSMPARDWRLYNAKRHTVVIDSKGLILDINASHSEPSRVIDQVRAECLSVPHKAYSCVDGYIAGHLERFPFGKPTPMAWKDREGTSS